MIYRGVRIDGPGRRKGMRDMLIAVGIVLGTVVVIAAVIFLLRQLGI